MSERHEQVSEPLEPSGRQGASGVVEARAAVVATEQAVRVAVERAREVTLRLERLGSGRHLAHELVAIEVEIDRAWQRLHEAERRMHQMEHAQQPQQAAIQEHVEEAPQLVSNQAVPPDAFHEMPLQQKNPLHKSETLAQEPEEKAQEAEVSHEFQESPRDSVTRIEQTEQIERIDAEEELVEMGAAMTAADIAASAAAEAEAFAEASSARVRELQRLAAQTDWILERVREAIQRGVLVGDTAQAALNQAERDTTHAHMLLAEGEMAEERARRAAMNAEAEAEVAEGMARATQGRYAHEEEQDTDDTLEMPSIHLQFRKNHPHAEK